MVLIGSFTNGTRHSLYFFVNQSPATTPSHNSGTTRGTEENRLREPGRFEAVFFRRCCVSISWQCSRSETAEKTRAVCLRRSACNGGARPLMSSRRNTGGKKPEELIQRVSEVECFLPTSTVENYLPAKLENGVSPC